MRKFTIYLLSLILIFVLITTGVAFAFPQNDPNLTLVASIPVGEGIAKAQVLSEIEGSTSQGPESLAVSPNGDIYVLDSIQNQILVVKDGKVQKTISLPFVTNPLDILVFKNHIFLLDSDPVVYETTLEGQIVKEYPLPEGMGSLLVHRLAVSNGHVVLWTLNYHEISLDNMPEKLTLEDLEKKSNKNGVANTNGQRFSGSFIDWKRGEISSNDDKVKIPIEMNQAFGSVTITSYDQANNIYAVVEELADPSPVVLTEVTIRRYNKKGEMTGIVKYPTEEMVSYPYRPVDITPSGKVYLLVPSKKEVKIYETKLSHSYVNNLEQRREDAVQKYMLEKGMNSYGTFVGNPYSRSATRDRAYQMADLTWNWDPSKFDYLNNGTYRPSDAPRPTQLSSSSSHSTTGIPYLWGGWDSLWSKTDGSPWTTFSSSLTYYSNKGPLIGDTSGAGPVYYGGKGTGIDCSGFVSAAADTYSFSSSKPGTSQLNSDGINVYDQVGNNVTFSSYSGMQPMDFFVSSSHVFNYDYRALDGTGVYTVESTVGKANVSGDNMQGAKRYFRPWSNFSGYEHNTWWSKASGNDWDVAYTSTGSYYTMKGYGQHFKFPYNGITSTSVTVTVTPSYGDPDLYVYNSSFNLIGKATSYGGDSFTWTASPDFTYYIMVYGYSDTSMTITKSW